MVDYASEGVKCAIALLSLENQPGLKVNIAHSLARWCQTTLPVKYWNISLLIALALFDPVLKFITGLI